MQYLKKVLLTLSRM